MSELLVLGIESSCDETAAAVIAGGRRVLSNVIASQVDLFAQYGGVVPEIASRKHLELILPVIKEALAEAKVTIEQIDAIAVTHGPGLVGTLLVGLSAAKALAFAQEKPLIGVNHLQGHIYANWLVEWAPRRGETPCGAEIAPSSEVSPLRGETSCGAEIAPSSEVSPRFPLVCLIVSGGHTDLVYMSDHGQMELLGRTRDDAAGEAFDKVARSCGLGYPGGPAVEKLARQGNPDAVPLPKIRTDDPYDFSFSGLKTAVLQYVHRHEQKQGALDEQGRADLAASFQRVVTTALVERTVMAAREKGVKQVIMAGGVAANGALRQAMGEALAPLGIRLGYPPPVLCTDNAAMIGAAGHYLFVSGVRHGMDLNAIPSLGIL